MYHRWNNCWQYWMRIHRVCSTVLVIRSPFSLIYMSTLIKMCDTHVKETFHTTHVIHVWKTHVLHMNHIRNNAFHMRLSCVKEYTCHTCEIISCENCGACIPSNALLIQLTRWFIIYHCSQVQLHWLCIELILVSILFIISCCKWFVRNNL